MSSLEKVSKELDARGYSLTKTKLQYQVTDLLFSNPCHYFKSLSAILNWLKDLDKENNFSIEKVDDLFAACCNGMDLVFKEKKDTYLSAIYSTELFQALIFFVPATPCVSVSFLLNHSFQTKPLLLFEWESSNPEVAIALLNEFKQQLKTNLAKI